MRQTLAGAAAMLFILAAALALRLPRLGDRPFHGDEAVHAAKFRDLWEKGRYEYDPSEYHGPTIYYAALPVVLAKRRGSFAETTETDYRLALALIGAAMVLLYPLLRDGIGTAGALWAALLTAVSSPFVFYSRYFIQEVALVCFTLALIACGWRYHVSGRTAWLMGAALAAGLLIATKETSVLTFAALGLAWLAARPERKRTDEASGADRQVRSGLRFALAIILALGVASVLLSGFFSHVRGPLGYFETYAPWLRRAGGTDLHRHPWHYYLSLVAWQHPEGGPVWTELLILGLAAVGSLTATSRKMLEWMGACPGFVRFVLVYSLALTAIYSLIPYKTPWNLLSFYLGFILLAGLGTGAILSSLRSLPPKAAGAVLLLVGAGHLAWQAGRTTFEYRDDNAGPYAYAQPLRGVREIEQRVNDLAAFSPHKGETVAQVVFKDDYYWPLPWYLRRLRHVGYWSGGVPVEAEARLTGTPIVLSSAEFDEELTERLGASHFMIGFHSLRPGVLVQMWVKNELWEPFVMSRTGNGKPER
ncbi:MAG TPA: flippase activity-associated protein Agl23 [Armatimonadota bacterium]|nr:flippase activity-associated protein Agl23 [Armatimonadota bacterium]